MNPHQAPTQRALLASLSPLSQHTAQVPYAWLAFARPGVPFAEPATASVIVQGLNDDGAPAGTATQAYRRWVWERCAPGMEFEAGAKVPWLEVSGLRRRAPASAGQAGGTWGDRGAAERGRRRLRGGGEQGLTAAILFVCVLTGCDLRAQR